MYIFTTLLYTCIAVNILYTNQTNFKSFYISNTKYLCCDLTCKPTSFYVVFEILKSVKNRRFKCPKV